MTRRTVLALSWLCGVCLLCASAPGAGSLVLTGADGRPVLDSSSKPIPIAWRLDAMPTAGRVPWDLSALGDPDGVLSTEQIETILALSFQTWEDVETSNLAFVANHMRCPNNDGQLPRPAGLDGDNLITFTDPDSDLVFQPGMIAVSPAFALLETYTFGNLSDSVVEYVELGGLDGAPDLREGTYPPGTIIDADILFHPDIDFVVGTDLLVDTAQDLQSVATHEIGHFVGLMHSVVGEAVGTRRSDPATMYPIVHEDPGVMRSLEPDDVASVSALYPAASFAALGSISGQISDETGVTVGAAVLALPLREDGTLSDGAVFAVSDLQGNYKIPGLGAGSYLVSVQPFTRFEGGMWKDRYNAITVQASNLSFPQEFWNAGESDNDDPAAYGPVALAAGQHRTGVNIVLNAPDTIQDYFEINDNAVQATPIEPNRIGGVWAVIEPDDRDFYRFTAADQSAVVIEIGSHRFGTSLDAVAVLTDAETGEMVGYSDNRFYMLGERTIVTSADPLIAVEDLPGRGATREYVIEVRAVGNASSGPYQLTVQTSQRLNDLLADLSGDGVVDAQDAVYLLVAPRPPVDINNDRIGDYRDIFRLKQEWCRR